MPKVSVIIPVYGVEKYIERCARSLFEQTLDDIEYLFIDDCTPDRSIEVLKSILEEYPNRKEQVIIHRMEQNSGQAAVRIWGMLNATGDYTIHCDSDDWVDVDMYRAMYKKAVDNGADCVICDYYQHNGTFGNIKKGCNDSDKRDMIINDFFKCRFAWSVWNKLFRRTCLSNIAFPKGNMGEDMVLSLQSLTNCKSIVHLPIPLYYYFINENSITRQKSIDSIYDSRIQLKNNVDVLLEFIQKNKFKFDTFWLKLYFKQQCYTFCKDKRIRNLFRTSYPGFNKSVLSTKDMHLKSKVKYFYLYFSVLIKSII